MLGNLIKALQAGRSLSDPVKWKKGHFLTTAVGAVVAFVVEFLKWQFPDVRLPLGVEEHAIEIICSGLIIINLYLIPATTEKFGTKQKEE